MAEDETDEIPLVDVTLIDAMLALTPVERLRQNDRMLRTIQELRDGFAAQGTMPAFGASPSDADQHVA